MIYWFGYRFVCFIIFGSLYSIAIFKVPVHDQEEYYINIWWVQCPYNTLVLDEHSIPTERCSHKFVSDFPGNKYLWSSIDIHTY